MVIMRYIHGKRRTLPQEGEGYYIDRSHLQGEIAKKERGNRKRHPLKEIDSDGKGLKEN
jgi:hypothetical protein